ncbi:MAG: helix-turn-helix transcriptional regulator [Betaproteobacteria bacterium]|nr:helix-turn-helix transcriptional regulator [Betaproteobacteria bacterium]
MPKSKKVQTPPDASALLSLARQVRGWADTVLSVAGNATDLGLTLAQGRLKDPGQKAAVTKAGRQLRQWREAAGLTLEELSTAVGLGDAKLIKQAEGGSASLPFDLMLRLAGVLGRRDPLPVAMALTRQYNPELWKTLEGLGIGKLAVHGSREREVVNIYRGSDAARELDDARFAAVLAFTRQAFESAVLLTAPAVPAAARAPAAAGRGTTRSARPRRTADEGTAAASGRDKPQKE